MKRIISGLIAAITIFCIMFNSSVKAQQPAVLKVFAVINKAGWCPVCRHNGPRIMSEVIPGCKNLKVMFISNDLTNSSTILKSDKELKTYNILNAVKEINETGIIILVDYATKKVIGTISTDESSSKIIEAIKNAQG